MREYIAAYIDTRIEDTINTLKNISEKNKVVRIYDSPTIKSLQEQIHYARAQGFEGIKFLINDIEDSQNFVSMLNESYGYLFKEGIGLVKLQEDEPINNLSADEQDIQNLKTAQQVSSDQAEMEQQKHTMYIVNPIGIIPFRTENNVCKEILSYINAAITFIERYRKECDIVYIADFIPLNNKLSNRFNSTVYLKDNIAWLKSDKCNLPENERQTLYSFFSNDGLAQHKSWSTQDALVHEVGMIGNYLFGPSIFWENLTGFHLNNNKNINKYNTKVNSDILEYVNSMRDKGIIKVTDTNYLKFEQPTEGFYFGWGNGANLNKLTSIERIGDTFFTQFKNCCKELSLNKMPVPENTTLKSSNIVSYLSFIISHYVVDSEFRNAVENNKKNKNEDDEDIRDIFEPKGDYNSDYWNDKKDEDSLNKLVDKYVLNKEIDGEKWVDKTLEQWYNRDSFFKDKLGLEDGKEKYDYKKYQQKAHELGISGYQLYKIDMRKKEIDAKIDEYLIEIESLDDSDKEESNLIKDINKEINLLKQEKKDLQAYTDILQRSEDKTDKMYSINNTNTEDYRIEDSKDFNIAYNRCVRLLNSNYHQMVQKIIIEDL